MLGIPACRTITGGCHLERHPAPNHFRPSDTPRPSGTPLKRGITVGICPGPIAKPKKLRTPLKSPLERALEGPRRGWPRSGRGVSDKGKCFGARHNPKTTSSRYGSTIGPPRRGAAGLAAFYGAEDIFHGAKYYTFRFARQRDFELLR